MNTLPRSARLSLLLELCDYISAADSAAQSGQLPKQHNPEAGQSAPRVKRGASPLGMPDGAGAISSASAPSGAVGGARAAVSMTLIVDPQSAQKVRANETLTIGR